MLEPGTFKAARGFVKCSYRTAAEVSRVHIAFDKKTKRATLGALVGTSDPYLLQQRPLLFVVPTKAAVFRWPIESVQVVDGQLHARLGALLVGE